MDDVYEAREKLLSAACGYLAAEKYDSTGPHYDAELELRDDILQDAVREYADALVRQRVLKEARES